MEYTANTQHPLFDTLQKIVLKHLGLEDIVQSVLERMGEVEQIVLIGDYARGIDSGAIEVFLIGKGLNADYIAQLEPKIEALIGRKIQLYIGTRFTSKQPHIILYDKTE